MAYRLFETKPAPQPMSMVFILNPTYIHIHFLASGGTWDVHRMATSRCICNINFRQCANHGENMYNDMFLSTTKTNIYFCCPACRTYLIATRFWMVMICPIIKCLTVLEFSFILFDLCLFITIFNFILNYVPIVTFWIFTYHKIWILLIIFCFIWNYWIIYFLICLEVFWSLVS